MLMTSFLSRGLPHRAAVLTKWRDAGSTSQGPGAGCAGDIHSVRLARSVSPRLSHGHDLRPEPELESRPLSHSLERQGRERKAGLCPEGQRSKGRRGVLLVF